MGGDNLYGSNDIVSCLKVCKKCRKPFYIQGAKNRELVTCPECKTTHKIRMLVTIEQIPDQEGSV